MRVRRERRDCNVIVRWRWRVCYRVYCLLLLRDKCGVTVVLVVVTTSPHIQILHSFSQILFSHSVIVIEFKEMVWVILCSTIRSTCKTKKHLTFYLFLTEQNSAMPSLVK